MRRLIPTLILAVLATSSFAQFTERTTPPPFRVLGYSWATDGRTFLLSKLCVYEVTTDLIVLPRFAIGHGVLWGFEVTSGFGEFRQVDVWGYELYGYLPIGGFQLRGGFGPMMDGQNRLTFPLRIELGWRF